MKMAQQPISLQSPVGDGEDTSLGDFIEDKTAENPSDSASTRLLREKIDNVLHSLAPREKEVLMLRFGLQDGYPRTLEEVGRHFRVTRERIRQIEAKALRKMRHPTRMRQLQGDFEGDLDTSGPGFDQFRKDLAAESPPPAGAEPRTPHPLSGPCSRRASSPAAPRSRPSVAAPRRRRRRPRPPTSPARPGRRRAGMPEPSSRPSPRSCGSPSPTARSPRASCSSRASRISGRPPCSA